MDNIPFSFVYRQILTVTQGSSAIKITGGGGGGGGGGALAQNSAKNNSKSSTSR